MTSEFRSNGDNAYTQAAAAFTNAEKKFQTSIVEAAVVAKMAEVQFWEDKCKVKAIAADLEALVDAEWTTCSKTFKIPTIIYSAEGSPTLGSWEVSKGYPEC